jgi:hypothetical protein
LIHGEAKSLRCEHVSHRVYVLESEQTFVLDEKAKNCGTATSKNTKYPGKIFKKPRQWHSEFENIIILCSITVLQAPLNSLPLSVISITYSTT